MLTNIYKVSLRTGKRTHQVQAFFGSLQVAEYFASTLTGFEGELGTVEEVDVDTSLTIDEYKARVAQIEEQEENRLVGELLEALSEQERELLRKHRDLLFS